MIRTFISDNLYPRTEKPPSEPQTVQTRHQLTLKIPPSESLTCRIIISYMTDNLDIYPACWKLRFRVHLF